jgi:hypothetical protein
MGQQRIFVAGWQHCVLDSLLPSQDTQRLSDLHGTPAAQVSSSENTNERGLNAFDSATVSPKTLHFTEDDWDDNIENHLHRQLPTPDNSPQKVSKAFGQAKSSDSQLRFGSHSAFKTPTRAYTSILESKNSGHLGSSQVSSPNPVPSARQSIASGGSVLATQSGSPTKVTSSHGSGKSSSQKLKPLRRAVNGSVGHQPPVSRAETSPEVSKATPHSVVESPLVLPTPPSTPARGMATKSTSSSLSPAASPQAARRGYLTPLSGDPFSADQTTNTTPTSVQDLFSEGTNDNFVPDTTDAEIEEVLRRNEADWGLQPHQSQGLAWMVQMEDKLPCGRGGLLADEMGFVMFLSLKPCN